MFTIGLDLPVSLRLHQLGVFTVIIIGTMTATATFVLDFSEEETET